MEWAWMAEGWGFEGFDGKWVRQERILLGRIIEFSRFIVNSVEQIQIIISQYLISIMDIEFTFIQDKKLSLFRPIEEFPVQHLYQQQITLENAFNESIHHPHPSILLTLIGDTLLLSNPTAHHVQPFAAVSLNFDLKFEVIYQTQKNIFSTKLGLKLFFDDKKYFFFFSTHSNIIEAWIYCLSKKINRKGFHQMFKPLKKLGKGNFASVYQVERLTDGAKFAVKAFSKQNCFNAKNGKESLINELSIMRQLSLQYHSNLLKLEGVYESDNSIYVVLQLLTGGQLFHKIQQANGFFTTEEVKQFMFGLLGGLKEMHALRIMHRDLKPQNIMLRSSTSMSPVIVDFGLATDADLEKYLFFRCGTPGYVAPEIIELNESKHIEPECDMFSAGVIFHILLTRKALFQGSKYEEVYRKNKEMNIKLDGEKYNNVDPQAMDLLRRMLLSNPAERVSAAQALSHPFFEDCMNLFEQNEKSLNSPCLTKVSEKRHYK